METTILRIAGMTCALCAVKIESALTKVAGVKSASVSYASESAIVVHEGVERVTLERSVAKAGFEVDEGDGGSFERHFRSLKIDLAASVILSLPLLLIMLVCTVDSCCIILDPKASTPFSLWVSSLRFALIPLHDWRIQAALAFPVQFIIGRRFYRNAFYSIRSGFWGMDLLIAIGTTSTYLLSIYLGYSFGSEYSTQLYFEASATVITLVLLGKYLETSAKRRSLSAIRSLSTLQAKTARVVGERGEVEIDIAQLRVGDEVSIRQGERIPADGLIVSGDAVLDESMLTGESMPVEKGLGDSVIAGTLNDSGAFVFRVEKTGEDTLLSQIIVLVETAQSSKTNIQRSVDKACTYFIPFVLLASAVTFCICFFAVYKGLPIFIGKPIVYAVSVLVISCPCALGLATPAAVSVGIGMAARRKILIRDGTALERACRVDTVLFDKTGTLTLGTLCVVDFFTRADGPFSKDELGRIAAIAEGSSSHPAALAIVSRFGASLEKPAAPSSFEPFPGRGIRARVSERDVVIGNAAFLRELGIAAESLPVVNPAFSVAYIAIDGRSEGAFILGDTLRESGASAIASLARSGCSVALLSGDAEAVVKAVGEKLGIASIHAGLLPYEKAVLVRSFADQGRIVAMVGDGINDAPALASADLSFAIGTGTDVAVEAGDIVLIDADLNSIPWLIDYSCRVMRTIRGNLAWSLAYNAIGIPIAACGLLNPELSCAAMALSSLSVLANSLRLGRERKHVRLH